MLKTNLKRFSENNLKFLENYRELKENFRTLWENLRKFENILLIFNYFCCKNVKHWE